MFDVEPDPVKIFGPGSGKKGPDMDPKHCFSP
jgi:hypothetical protein